nr:MAG TPA_asm: hypothetical protein [Caudoviricetes sp.]
MLGITLDNGRLIIRIVAGSPMVLSIWLSMVPA